MAQEDLAKAKAQPSDTASVSPEKARQILHDGEVHGKPLTEQQRKFFGAIGGHLPAPGKKAKKSQAPASQEEEERQEAKREAKKDPTPPPLPATSKSLDALDDFAQGEPVQKEETDMSKADDGKPGESLGETSTDELKATHKDIIARLKQDPKDAAALQARRDAIAAELKKRAGKTDLKAEKGCPAKKSEAGDPDSFDILGEFSKGEQGDLFGGDGGGKKKAGKVIAVGPRGGKIIGYKGKKPIYQHEVTGGKGGGKGGKKDKPKAKPADAEKKFREYQAARKAFSDAAKVADDNSVNIPAQKKAGEMARAAEEAARATGNEPHAEHYATQAKEYEGRVKSLTPKRAEKKAVEVPGLETDLKSHQQALKYLKAIRAGKTVENLNMAGALHNARALGQVLENKLRRALDQTEDPAQAKKLRAQAAKIARQTEKAVVATPEDLDRIRTDKKAVNIMDAVPGLHRSGVKGWDAVKEIASSDRTGPEIDAAAVLRMVDRDIDKKSAAQIKKMQPVEVARLIAKLSESTPSAGEMPELVKQTLAGPKKAAPKKAKAEPKAKKAAKPQGKVQQAVMDSLGMMANKGAPALLTNLAKQPAYRGIHFRRIQKAAEALEKKGLVKLESTDAGVMVSAVTEEAPAKKSGWDTLESAKDWKPGDPKPKFQYSWEEAEFEKKHPESKAKPKKRYRSGKRGTRLPTEGGSEQGQTPGKSLRDDMDMAKSLDEWLGQEQDQEQEQTENEPAPPVQKSEETNMSGIDKLTEFAQDEAQVGEDEDLEKAQSMPEGNPKQKLGQGQEQGGKLAGVGETKGSSDSAPGPGQNKDGQVTGSSTAKDKLSEDDEDDEAQMKPHKKPIETAKSVNPGKQREMVGQETAQVVSKLQKGEGDVPITGTGLPEQNEEAELEKGRVGRQGMVMYSDQSDIEAEALLKSDEFYSGGAPRVIPFSRPIGTGQVCLKCETLLSKSLTACPNCGNGAVAHQVVPGGEAQGDHDGDPIVKSQAGKLRPRHIEDVKIGK